MSDGQSPTATPDLRWRRRVSVAAVVGICVLALGETVSALVAPLRAPSDADWRATAGQIRTKWRPGDLIVAAPAWSDQVMRLHLGDLVPVDVAARLDEARFGRIWEVGQRGAHADSATGTIAADTRHGALRVRLFERPALKVSYDFHAAWASAQVSRQHPGQPAVACIRGPDQFQCPELSPGTPGNQVKPRVLEVGGALHRGLLALPVDDAKVIIEYPAVPLSRELAVGTGLHNVWWRRHGEGKVTLRVLIDGKRIAEQQATNRNGWQVVRYDTSAHAGKTATVRFEITADKAYARHFGFNAEARGS